MGSQPELPAQLGNEEFIVNAPVLVAGRGEGSMRKVLLRAGRPVARVADGLCYSRDRRKRIRQFQRVTRVTLRDY